MAINQLIVALIEKCNYNNLENMPYLINDSRKLACSMSIEVDTNVCKQLVKIKAHAM